MELKLEQFISNVELLTNIHQQNKNPIMFRLPLDGSQLGLLFYCSYAVPRYVVLPINAIWIDFDPESPTFRTAFKRTTKDNSDPYKDVWTALYFYADAMEEQAYDPNDLQIINTALPPLATSITRGVGYLSYPEAESRVILEGDETLTNNRDPKDHTHPEKPATMISINGSYGEEYVPIKDQLVPQVNQVMVMEEDSTLQWRKVRESELKTSNDNGGGDDEGGNDPEDPDPEDPDFPEEGYNDFIVQPKPIDVVLGEPTVVELSVHRRDTGAKVVPKSFAVRVVNNPRLTVVSSDNDSFLVTITASVDDPGQVFVCDYWFYPSSTISEQVRLNVIAPPEEEGQPEPEEWHFKCDLTVGHSATAQQDQYGFYALYNSGSYAGAVTDLYTGASAAASTICGYQHKNNPTAAGFLFRISDSATNNYIQFLADNREANLTVWVDDQSYQLGRYSGISGYKNYYWDNAEAQRLQQEWLNADHVGSTLNLLLQFSL